MQVMVHGGAIELPGKPPGSLWPRVRNPTGPMLVLRPSPTIRAAGELAMDRVRVKPERVADLLISSIAFAGLPVHTGPGTAPVPAGLLARA
jgi:hypothetical protein